MRFFLLWVLYSLAVLLTAEILPGVQVNNFWSAFFTVAILTILNVLVRPILIFLTLPINILTLGLFTFVINAVMILLVAGIVKGFEVDGFGWAFLFAILLSIFQSLLREVLSR